MLLNTAKVYGGGGSNPAGLSGISGCGCGPAKSTVRPTRLPGMAGMGNVLDGATSMAADRLRSAVESLGADVQKCDKRFYAYAGILPVLNPFYYSDRCANYRRELDNVNARLAGRASAGAAPGLSLPPGPASPNPLDNTPNQDDLQTATNQKTADWLRNYFANINVPDPETAGGTGGDPDEKRPGDISMWVWVGIAGIGLLALGNKR